MENMGKCESCKHYQGLVAVPNGFDILKNKIDCLMFGYLEVFINPDTCKLYGGVKDDRYL